MSHLIYVSVLSSCRPDSPPSTWDWCMQTPTRSLERTRERRQPNLRVVGPGATIGLGKFSALWNCRATTEIFG
jgi:hypothetical protein